MERDCFSLETERFENSVYVGHLPSFLESLLITSSIADASTENEEIEYTDSTLLIYADGNHVQPYDTKAVMMITVGLSYTNILCHYDRARKG